MVRKQVTPPPQPEAERVKIETVSLDACYVDERWQRARQDGTHFLLNERHREYVSSEKFDPNVGLIPHVAYTGHMNVDGFHVIDGQHLIERSRREGYTALPMKVFYNLTAQEISEEFLNLRRRTEVKGLDAFSQYVNAGYSWAISLTSILSEYGWTTDNRDTRHYFKAVATAKKVLLNRAPRQSYEDAEDSLRFSIGVITAAWQYAPGSAHQSIVTALTLVYRRKDFGFIDLSKLIEKLSQVPPETILFNSKSPHAVGSSGTKRVANEIINVYNKSKKGQRLPLI